MQKLGIEGGPASRRQIANKNIYDLLFEHVQINWLPKSQDLTDCIEFNPLQ